jgi:ABC-type phosphate/phosphonate transport system substrate-binding protein
MVVRRDHPASDLPHLRRQRLGYINRCCTTSYWAPMLLFQQRLPDLPASALDLVQVNGFDDLLASVTDGRAEVAMVWDFILGRLPELAAQVTAVARLGDLPTPVIVANEALPSDLRDPMGRVLADFRSDDPGDFFDGYTRPAGPSIEAFTTAIATARKQCLA